MHVRSFPDSGGRWQVSTNGGSEPTWRGDGRELFYIRADRKLIAVPVTLTSSFESGLPQALFEMDIPGLSTAYRSNYVAAKDGQRFLVNTVARGASPPPVKILLDWTAALKK